MHIQIHLFADSKFSLSPSFLYNFWYTIFFFYFLGKIPLIHPKKNTRELSQFEQQTRLRTWKCHRRIKYLIERLETFTPQLVKLCSTLLLCMSISMPRSSLKISIKVHNSWLDWHWFNQWMTVIVNYFAGKITNTNQWLYFWFHFNV